MFFGGRVVVVVVEVVVELVEDVVVVVVTATSADEEFRKYSPPITSALRIIAHDIHIKKIRDLINFNNGLDLN